MARVSRFRPCAIDGCDGNAAKNGAAMGWCRNHYIRWHRHGDPLGGRTSPGDLMRWIEAHVNHAEDECLLWPFGVRADGSGQITFRGNKTVSSRVMCILAHGEPPSPKHEAAHSCGNGHLACCNPRHLRWATHTENAADMLLHGTSCRGERHGASLLTLDNVREIRALAGTVKQRDLAARYGVCQATISRIITGSNWYWAA